MALRPGDKVADCVFYQPDGSTVALAAFAAPTLLLVFLRHLA